MSIVLPIRAPSDEGAVKQMLDWGRDNEKLK